MHLNLALSCHETHPCSAPAVCRPQVAETRGKGELLGETAFFFRLRHINSAAVGEGSTMLFALSYDDYQQLGSAYVEDAAKVMDIIIDLVSDSGKAGKSQGSAGAGSSTGCAPPLAASSLVCLLFLLVSAPALLVYLIYFPFTNVTVAACLSSSDQR
jgi:hypothetical protein